MTNPLKLSPVRVNPVLRHDAEKRLILDGRWRFRLDPGDAGIAEGWFADIAKLDEAITVPGCWQGQGFGNEGKDKLWDFRLAARVFRATYTGVGWYGTTFEAPADWRGQRLWLNFGGVHPSAEVWLNGVKLGDHDLPFVPFGFEVSGALSFETPNQLAVRVHEHHRRFGLAYSWQANWSGLYRGVELTATGTEYLERLWLYPDVDRELIRLVARIGDYAGNAQLKLHVSAQPISADGQALNAEIPVTGKDVTFELAVPAPRLWSPDAPELYRVNAVLKRGDAVLDAQSERTGFVKLSTKGKHFLINGEPYYMRGSGDFISCPETGCPDTDRERWRRKLKALRDYGYNHVRCQSYVYGPEYYDVADEVGLLVQSEMGMLGPWGGHTPWHVYQWPKPTPDNYPILKKQWDLVVMRDVNHPSANLYCMSNEYGADTHFRRIAWQCYHDTRAIKPTAFTIWTDGGYNPELPGDFVNAEGEKDDEIEKPLIQHEFRWWSSFPDVRNTKKYSGAVRPYGAEIAREAAERHGLAELLPRFAEVSQRLQFLEAKGKMEMCRRDHPRLAGICHFSAMDCNPSPQGIMDEFYELKYAGAELWRESNGDTVLLSSLGFDDRVLSPGETLSCALFISDFSHPPLETPVIEWQLAADEQVLAAGELPAEHDLCCTHPAGEIKLTVPVIANPVKARLKAQMRGELGESRDGTRSHIVKNAWDLWLVPKAAPLADEKVARYGDPQYTWLKDLADLPSVKEDELKPGGRSVVVLSETLDGTLVEFMHKGGRLILAASEGLVRPHLPNFGSIKYFFTPPANYPPYEDGQHGTLIASHPMLGNLPHEGFADLFFFRMIENAPPLDLEPLGLTKGEPVIRVIHRYPVCHPLGYLLEVAYGAGGMIISALDLNQAWPEARYLLAQLCNYATSGTFRPAMSLGQGDLARIVTATALP